MKNLVYPGSFDPVTLGHLDIIKRAAAMTDHLVVCVMNNSDKHSLFSVPERVNMLQNVTSKIDNVEIDCYGGLMIDYCREHNIHTVIRGLRAITDFEYELQIAQTNKELSHNYVDTVFLATNLLYSNMSSSTVKEFARYHCDVSECVPEIVCKNLIEKYK